MPTILVAHRDLAFGEGLAAALRAGGYRVMTCPGPRAYQCRLRCDPDACPLIQDADLMLYDPHLTRYDADGQRYNVAVVAALARPDVPMLLAWPPAETPRAGALRILRDQAPHIGLAEHDATALVRQVDVLLAPAAARTPR